MPMQWVPPEVFLRYKGVTIYHVYKDDDMESGTRTYWYGTSELASDCDGGSHEFDVRDLKTWKQAEEKASRKDDGRDNERQIRWAIKRAIDLGLVKSTE